MDSNTKLEAITEKTLIVGVDLAKRTNVARAIDYRGTEMGSRLSFENSRDGYSEFLRWSTSIMAGAGLEEIIIGVEPTGVYGLTFIGYAKDAGLRIVYILGMQVKRAKEIEDNSPAKNDIKDAKVIANLVKDGYYRVIRTHSPETAELKVLMKQINGLTKKLVRTKSQIQDILIQYFPEFETVFKCFENKTAMATLRNFPLPPQIACLTVSEIVKVWRSSGVIKGIGEKRAAKLKRAAKETVGLPCCNAVMKHLSDLIDEYDLLKSQEHDALLKAEALLKDNSDYAAIMKIPGMSIRLTAYLLAEVGDFSDFSHPRQLIRLAGLNLKESSSGGKRGHSEIAKRGRTGLRRALYFIVLELLKRKTPEWHRLHKMYTTRKENPLKKMQSVIALCCKFLRVVFGMLKNDTPYDPGKVIEGHIRNRMAA